MAERVFNMNTDLALVLPGLKHSLSRFLHTKAAQKTHVHVTVSIGADLGLDFGDIAESAGLSGSVATTKTKGTTQGVTGSCPPGPWSCSLSITGGHTKSST